jgi:hypothetical protein
MIRKTPKECQIGFKCTKELRAQLERLSITEKTDMTDVITRILENGLEAEQERAEKIQQILNI